MLRGNGGRYDIRTGILLKLILKSISNESFSIPAMHTYILLQMEIVLLLIYKRNLCVVFQYSWRNVLYRRSLLKHQASQFKNRLFNSPGKYGAKVQNSNI